MDEKALERAATYIKGWLRFHYEREDTPGFVVAIAHKGQIIFNEAYGYANLEKKIKLLPDHIFRIASHSKTFTATAIMQLQEQDKLKIDDHAINYLPWLKQHKDKRWQKVTIRQLLSHGAGVIRDGSRNEYWNVTEPFPDKEEFKADILASDLIIENNTKLKYSNFGYTLLGLIVAELSGQPYNDFVVNNIVKPLGLKNTGPELTNKIKDQLVMGYSSLGPHKKRLPVAQIDTRVMSAATGFYSTAEELCVYFTAQMQGSGKLLNDESKKQMQKIEWEAENTNSKDGYGLGFELESAGSRKVIGHGGGFPGHITKSLFDPKDKLVVIVLTNANGSSAGHMAKSTIKVIDFFQKDTSTPKWRKYEGRYMNLWWNADIVAHGDKLIAADADNWEPFSQPEELEHLEENVFKVSKASSFSSIDEKAEFKMNTSGAVERMIYAGGTLLPETDYIKQMSQKSQIGKGIVNKLSIL